MSIRCLSTKIWVCEYYTVENGKKRHVREPYGRGESGKLAATARDDELKAAKITTPRALRGPLFSELVQSYQEAKFKVSGGMSETDQVNTYHKLDANIMPYFGGRYTMDFNDTLMDGYINLRSSQWSNGIKTKKIKITTIHRELSIVKAVLNWSVQRKPQLIPYNPVDKYKLPRRDDEIIMPPTKEERQRIHDSASPHVKRFIILNYNTGARSGASEILRINWEHVDIESKIIVVLSADKGGPKLRRVPISAELEEHLLSWRKQDADTRKLESPSLLSGPIIHFHGKPIDKIGKAWRTTLKRAGITRRIRPYDLRHAFATDLLSEGADLKAVSRIMGHSRPDTTIRVYQHVSGKQERAVLDKLPRAIKKDGE